MERERERERERDRKRDSERTMTLCTCMSDKCVVYVHALWFIVYLCDLPGLQEMVDRSLHQYCSSAHCVYTMYVHVIVLFPIAMNVWCLFV